MRQSNSLHTEDESLFKDMHLTREDSFQLWLRISGSLYPFFFICSKLIFAEKLLDNLHAITADEKFTTMLLVKRKWNGPMNI